MTDATTAAPVPAPKVRKGPLRHEAIVPFAIFVALVWVYFALFFDSNVRRALEYAATEANGAEVNIASIRTSFRNASLEVGKVQVTDALKPARNSLQIAQVRWKMRWDALLRGKIAIDEASILGVAIGVPREHPGRVLPPPNKPTNFGVLKDQALARAQAEFSKNVLGDVAALLNGADPSAQLRSITGTLTSGTRVKELQAQLGITARNWHDRVDSLPRKTDIDAIDARLRAVKVDRFTSVSEVKQSLQQLDSILRDVQAKVKRIDDTKRAFTADASGFQGDLAGLEAMVQQDTRDLEKRIKLPKIDAQSFSRVLFGPGLLEQLRKGEAYVDRAREWAPPIRSAAERAKFLAPTPHEREKGRNYRFGRPNEYPFFWLKKAQLSSTVTAGADLSGNLSGTLLDVTDDPPTLGRPTIALFKGDFPKQGVLGVTGQLTMDHVRERAKESLALRVAEFPVAHHLLIDSPDAKLGIDGAARQMSFNAEFSGDDVKITSASSFQQKAQPTPAVAASGASPARTLLFAEATQPLLNDILRGALAGIPKVTVAASVTGRLTDPQFTVESSLGRDLTAAFDQQIQAKINEAKAKLQAYVNEQVGAQQARLLAEFNRTRDQVDGLIKERQDELDRKKAAVETAITDVVESQKKMIEGQGQDAFDKLRKRIVPPSAPPAA